MAAAAKEQLKKYIISIDLGTTNFKFALYDVSLNLRSIHSKAVDYLEQGCFVEFDVERYYACIESGIRQLLSQLDVKNEKVVLICLTGQAESLVFTDSQNKLLCNGISWKDSRSQEEAGFISEYFGENWFAVTGLPQVSTTWPVTKLLWLKNHQSALYTSIARIYLLKDYIIHRLTGRFVSEYSIQGFSGAMSIRGRQFWDEMMKLLGIRRDMLPEMLETGAIAGCVTKEAARGIGLEGEVLVSIGALDHVAGMVGTGNIQPGRITASLGTVNALAMNVTGIRDKNFGIEYHHGATPHSLIQLLVIESGGVSLQWFKDHFMPAVSFQEIDQRISEDDATQSGLIFLPYVCGVNPPENDASATGVFYDFDMSNNVWHFARAVFEANGFLLRKNIEYWEENIQIISTIFAVGGAAGSPVFCQLLADITKKQLTTFSSSESVVLGAAILGAVAAGYFDSIESAVGKSVRTSKVFLPRENPYYDQKFLRFTSLYKRLFD